MSGTPYQSPNTTEGVRKPRSPWPTVWKVVIMVVIVGVLIGIFLAPVRRGVPAAARRMACMNNVHQIALGLLNYEAANGTLPPAYTVDGDGNRLHSWRSLILPFIEQQELFEMIDFSKPWDHPDNKEARESSVDFYWCPSALLDDGLTPYCGVFGSDFVFSGSVPRKLSEVTDGSSNTIAVCEVDVEHAVHWMSPYDVEEDVLLAYGPDSKMNHPGIMIVAFLDGSIHSLSLEEDSDYLHAMLTIAGDEELTNED